MECTETQSQSKNTDGCFERTHSSLTVDDVYEIAKLIGSEVEKLIDGYGKDSVVVLVPKIVKVLELLETFASRNDAHKQKEEELLKAFETFQLQQHKKRAAKDNEDCNKNEIQPHSCSQAPLPVEQELEQEEEQWRRRCEELQAQVQQLEEDRQELQSRLKGDHKDRVHKQEREVMLKLKEVVDKQRDQLRAKVQEIGIISKEVEALQEQLERFMKMNGELRHKQNVMQAQLKSSVERKTDMEADLTEKDKQIEALQSQLDKANTSNPASPCQKSEVTGKREEKRDSDQPCFTKKEVREMLYERNELKANLFLVQEELNYYQSEILNDERCPGFLLDAVRATIKKQRTRIKSKMLGIPVDECSSDEEVKGPLFEQTETDAVQEKPAESRIKNLFGFLTRSGSGSRISAHVSNSASTWEIIEDSEASGEAEPQPSPCA